jgi:glycosyltransferase involved in cell wall biosynthesis
VLSQNYSKTLHAASPYAPELRTPTAAAGPADRASAADLERRADARPLLSLVVPFYNEAPVVEAFFDAVMPVLRGIPDTDYEIVCVNDGSTDATLDKLLAVCRTDYHVRVIDLSRNFGKEAALTAGIDEAEGAAVIPFDADLQDPPEVIPQLVAKWRQGYDVVLARRSERRTDTYAKRGTAALFYRVHNAISDIAIPDNAGDFRLMSRQVVESLKQLPENRRFMKGLFAWVGFRTAQVEYVRPPRVGGKSKFSGWKLWNLALEGLTSFSTLPLRVWTYLGGLTAGFAIVYAAYLIVRTCVRGIDVPGYASIITAVLFLGGVQLIGIGVIGEYVGRIYMESKRRPIYIVRDTYRLGQR